MKKKKGFTLIELIIVIAIIGILAAVLIPSWNHMIAKARVKSQNNNAKVVFDAAQKECIDLKRRDRTLRNDIKRQQEIIASPTQSDKAKEQAEENLTAAMASQFITSDFYFYFDGKKGYACDENCNDISANADMNKEFTDAIKRNIATSNDELVYKIHIKDYNVVSVATARFDTDSAMGSYPVARIKRTKDGVKGFDLSKAEKTYAAEEESE